MFKKLEINIPFAKALAQIPNYAKFMKDIMSKKRKLDDCGIVNLLENCSAVIQRKIPQKMQDPRSFTIPYAIRNHEFGASIKFHPRSFTFHHSLCHRDSGASINLIPSSVARRLSLRELSPANLTLQMAYRSIVKLEGIIEDVLVKLGKYIFPIDFVVINMEEDKHVPLLLGRPFLATSAVMIDVKRGDFES